GADRRAAGRRAAERGRAEPGAVPLRVGRADGRGATPRSGERPDLAGRNDLGWTQGDQALRLELADRRRGDRARGGRLQKSRLRPGAGPVELALELPAQGGLEPLGDVDQRVEVDARPDPLALKQVD